MASCRIDRDNQGNIRKVSTSEGTESTLYNTIVRHPMVETPEVALNIYKNTLTKSAEEGAQWTHRLPDGAFTTSYKEALEQTPEGATIEVGFFSDDIGFTSIIPIVKTTNKDTERGYLNHLIVNNIMRDTKERNGVDYYFAPVGQEEVENMVKADMIQQDAFVYLGTLGVERFGNLFKLRKTKGRTRVIAKNGEVLDMNPDELDTQTYQELSDKYEEPEEIIAEREYFAAQKPYSHVNNPENQPETERSEEDLQLRLLTLLNKLGVKVTSISKYVQNYKIKHGVNPSARALADIGNQVIAFQNGEVRLDELTEETAHFIVEAMPISETADVLRNVHKSEEWAQHSEAYREIYSDRYQGEALDQAVRREVLGKIVANSIRTNFDKVNKSEAQQSFIDKALDMVRNFFDTIADYFKPQYKTELDTYLSNIENIIYSEDVANSLNSEQFKDNKFTLYSVGANPTEVSILNSTNRLIKTYEKQLKNLSRAGKVSKTDLRKVEEIQSNLENSQQKNAVAGLVSMVNDDLRKLEAGLEAIESGKATFLSNEEDIVYKNLINNIRPSLSEIRILVRTKGNTNSEWSKLYNDLGEVITRVDDFQGRERTADNESVKKFVDEIIERHEIPASKRHLIEDWIDKAGKDTSWYHTTFGQMVHAKDGMINLLGMQIRGMRNKGNVWWMEPMKRLQSVMRDNGVTAKDIGSKFFAKGGFVVNEIDNDLHEDVMNFIHAKNYKKVTGSTKTIEELVEAYRLRELDGTLTASQEVEFRDLNRAEEAIFNERPFTQEYYDETDKQYGNLHTLTREWLRAYYADTGSLKKKAFSTESYVDNKGVTQTRQILNFQNLTPQDRVDFFRLHRNRADKKSYIDTDGSLKKGLYYTRSTDDTIQRDERGKPIIEIERKADGTYGDNVSGEAIVAYEMNTLDNSFDKDQGEVSLDLFYQMLDQVQTSGGKDEAIKFLEMNAYLGFSDAFWESLGEGGSIVDNLLASREDRPEDYRTITDLANSITEADNALKGILRLYQKKNSPSEIDADSMSDSDRDRVKQLREDLATFYEQAKTYSTNEFQDSLGESSVNQAYNNKIEKAGLQVTPQDTYDEALIKLNQEAEEARPHMTDANKSRMSVALLNFDNFRKSTTDTLSKGTQNIMERLGYDAQEMRDSDEAAIIVRREIVRSRLLPYYKSFTPRGYNTSMEAIRNSENIAKDLRNLIEGSPFLELTPNHTFFDKQQNDRLNVNYDTNYQGGYNQPKRGVVQIPAGQEFKELRDKFGSSLSFESKQFQNLFGQLTKDASGVIQSVSKNGKLFNVYQELLNFHFAQLEAVGVGAGYNKFLAPNVRKNTLERVTKFAGNPSAAALKNAFKDVVSFTEDDMVSGDTQYGTDIKVIPRMYTRKLEDPEDISTELFYSITLMAKESYMRKARVESWGDVMSVYNKILERNYDETGKEAVATNTVKMVNNAIDYNMFGIKEVRTLPLDIPLIGRVDVAKIARNILSYIKLRNLGFNVIIPLTSYITGGVFQKIEVLVNEYLHPRSQKIGTKEFRKLAAGGIKEIGKIDTTAPINVLGQYFRSFDLQTSLENSNYGWVARAMPRLGMMLHSMANFPIYAKTLMGVLHDYRVVGNKVMNFNTFKRLNPDLSKKELNTEWNKSEADVFYNYMKVENAQVVFDKDGLGDKLGLKGKELDDYIAKTVDGIQQYITVLNEFVDGQLSDDDKVYATRDAFWNYFMTHRGWLSIITARRFKNRHLNLTLGMEEEGSYRSMWNFLGDYLKEFNGKNIASVIQNGKEAWNKPPIPSDAVVRVSPYNNFTSHLKNRGAANLQKGDYTRINVGDNIKYYIYEGGDTTKRESYTEVDNELQQRNVKRVMIEMAALNTIMILAFILNKVADDDDNKDIFTLQASNYLMLRTLNEMSSSQLALANNYSEVIDAPFVGWNTAKEMTNVMDLFSGEEVKYGNYRGMTERSRWLTKVLPAAKQYKDLQNMTTTKNTYLFYNNSNFKPNALGFLDWSNSKEE